MNTAHPGSTASDLRPSTLSSSDSGIQSIFTHHLLSILFDFASLGAWFIVTPHTSHYARMPAIPYLPELVVDPPPI